MATNIEVPAENAEDRYCYVGADGKVQKGWRYDSGLHEWQYADKDEKTKEYLLAKQEWKQINGTWYYFDEYSIMVSNTIKNTFFMLFYSLIIHMYILSINSNFLNAYLMNTVMPRKIKKIWKS